MFYYKVIDSAFKKKSLYLNNFGNHSRDFTYIRDVNIILFNLLRKKTKFKNEIFNICSNKPFQILKIVKLVEKYTNKISLKKRKIQKADVLKTHGENKKLKKYRLIKNFTSLERGILNTINWYKNYNSY